MARFNRKLSFHFPRVFPLISDWSVWHNGKQPRAKAQDNLMLSINLSSRLQNGAEDLLVQGQFCLYPEHKVLIRLIASVGRVIDCLPVNYLKVTENVSHTLSTTFVTQTQTPGSWKLSETNCTLNNLVTILLT